MSLFLMILRKMAKNRWLELSLLLGLIISVALASSMPIYTHAILQRMLIKDLEVQQTQTQQYPGQVYNHAYFAKSKDGDKRLTETDALVTEQVKRFGLPILLSTITRSTQTFDLTPSDPSKVDPLVRRYGELAAMTDLEKHIRLVDGVMPSSKSVDGVYEAWVFPELLTKQKIVLGNELTIVSNDLKNSIRIKPVAVIDRADFADMYWTTNKMNDTSSRFFIPYALFDQDFTKNGNFKDMFSYWNHALDYHQLKLEGIDNYIATYKELETYFRNLETFTSSNPTITTLQSYGEKEKKLRILLWSLNVPVCILLAFYLFMVANLITERQKTEIAVLRSRGASRAQILIGYVIEGILLGGVALLIGPFVGLQLTKVLGASNGFLTIVQRAAMEVKLNEEAYQYGLIAVIASVCMTLIPAVLATRVSIVGHKQTLARKNKLSFVHKIYLDMILLAVSMYLLQSFKRRMDDLVALGLDSMDMKVDPLLFVVPAFFIFAMGLFLLRIYPWVIQLIYTVGRKWWPAYLYSTLLQVGRSTTQYQFIMLFIIMTLATGIFSASAARTMNKNVEEKIHYKNGSDIVLQTAWDNDAPPPETGPPGPSSEAKPQGSEGGGKKRVQYVEPPFMPFTQLTGVEAAARVFQKKDAYLGLDKDSKKITLMGIDTDDFGRTAWFRDHLLDHHFYDYLNLLATDSKAVLISRSIAEETGAEVGDVVRIGWNDVEGATAVIYGIIDYWPSWNPNPILTASTSSVSKTDAPKQSKVDAPKLVIGHLSYIQNNLAVEPYDVWLKLKPGMTSQALYEALDQKHMKVSRLVDTNMMVIGSKNDPFQLAVNGVMTLGFLIAIGISFIGFLLYWLLSLYGQILQFGVLRAMGISYRQLIGMLVAEQLLTSGAAVLIGMITGNTASRLFVPLFQLTFDSSSQVPPFQVSFDPRDQLHLYIIVTIMIGMGLLLLGTMLSRIKIHQAVKLGED